MNQAIKVTIPKHIDPREVVKKTLTTEIVNMSMLMKDSGTTPYRYIRRAMACLVKGEYDNACNWLTYADNFTGVFWTPFSAEDEAFKTSIGVLRLHFLFLIEKFKELKPEKDQEE